MIQPFHSSILQEFEDIIQDETGTPTSNSSFENPNDNESPEEEETIIPLLDANSLTLKDLLHEMERRGLHPRGFFADDAKVLQIELNKEHDEYIESKRREKQEAKEMEASQRLFRRRKALTEIALREEKEVLEKNERFREWFHLIQHGRTPSCCRIEVNNASARSLARLLWCDKRIVQLDVSNLNLSDMSGAYIARMLKNNSSLRKLELGDNSLGHKTCITMAESLRVNEVLEYLSLDSNPLTSNQGTLTIEALADIVRENKTLRYLNLWRCNIGVEGGRLISEAMKSNDKLTCIEMGYNQWQHSDIITIKKILSKNKGMWRKELEEKADIARKEKEAEDLARKEEEQKKREADDRSWLESQKVERAEQRRVEMERALEKQRVEEEETAKELEMLRLEEEKKKTKRKKKKKGKKVSQ